MLFTLEFMQKVKLRFENIEIIEYYDGLVRGIAETLSNSYLAVMTEWKIDSSERRFGFLEIDSSEAAQIRLCFDPKSGRKTKKGRWNDFEAVYNEIVRSYSKKLYQLSVKPRIHEEYVLDVIDYDPSHLKLENYDMENVIA